MLIVRLNEQSTVDNKRSINDTKLTFLLLQASGVDNFVVVIPVAFVGCVAFVGDVTVTAGGAVADGVAFVDGVAFTDGVAFVGGVR